MQQDFLSVLSTTDIFDSLTQGQLELIAAICVAGSYPNGATLLRENEKSDELYIIAQGEVEVLVNPGFVDENKNQHFKPISVTFLRQGQVFGEIALVDQGVRSATIKVTSEETRLLRIPRDRLMLLCDTYPELGYKFMKNLAADLAFKIRNTDLTLRQYQMLIGTP